MGAWFCIGENPKVRATGFHCLLCLSSLLHPAISYVQPLIHNIHNHDQRMQSPSAQLGDMLIHDIHLPLTFPPKIQGALASQLQWSSAITTVPLWGLLPWETGPGLASHLNRHVIFKKIKNKSKLWAHLYHLAAKYTAAVFKSSHYNPVKAN